MWAQRFENSEARWTERSASSDTKWTARFESLEIAWAERFDKGQARMEAMFEKGLREQTRFFFLAWGYCSRRSSGSTAVRHSSPPAAGPSRVA
jgi:hypothetical protein